MEEQLKALQVEIAESLKTITDSKSLYSLQAKYLGKNGEISNLSRELGKAPKEDRPTLGKLINETRNWVEEKFLNAEKEIEKLEMKKRYENEKIDITLPSIKQERGTLHPITIVTKEIISIFEGLGFSVFEGPEIETDYYNFSALNVPKDHPARDMQDTLFITNEMLLRTQTSAGQIRVMETNKPPIKVIIPGKVYRNDDDATHSPMFHQMEGLIVDKNLTVCDLYGILDNLAKKLFSENTKTRLRPSFFPFTEPSVEVDVECFNCGGKGCKLCKNTGWIEILGGGMVHPNVLKNGGIDPDEYTGIALGVGMDRIVMLKYGVENIKLLFDNNIKLLKQFKD